jgi:tetratricopeptide (TPR) repeat protein
MKRLILLSAIGASVLFMGVVGLPAARADVVHLTDGTTVSGDIKKTDDGWIVTPPGGKPVLISADRVDSIELRPADNPNAAEDRLASLRRAVGNVSDIKIIITRYEAFIQDNPESKAATEAEADLADWRDRQSRGLVKVGTQWVTPEEKADTDHKADLVAEDVRQLLTAGKIKDATDAIDKTLLLSPDNISLLYLRGVLAYRLEQLVPARKAFEAVLAISPNDGPSLNNLAVITWRQNNIMVAMNFYDQAMVSAPMSRQILDNVAEALNSLPPERRKTPLVEKVVRHFNEQDSDLQKKLADQGLSRWGSSWVTDAQRAKLEATAKSIQDQIDAQSKKFDDLTADMQKADQTVSSDQVSMQNIINSCTFYNPNGQMVQTPFPAEYYNLQRDIQLQKAQKIQDAGEQGRLHDQAVALKAKQPSRYTGIQRLIDVEGMPMAITPGDPTTQPGSANFASPATTQPAMQ